MAAAAFSSAACPACRRARSSCIGGGVVGTQAARMAVGLGAEVTILDRSLPRLRALDDLFAGRVRTRFSTREAVAEEVYSADAVIGAVLIPGAAAPKLVTRAMLAEHEAGRGAGRRRHRPGRLLRDLACRPPMPSRPIVVDGIVHYCVANMPGAVPLTSSHALNNATLPFGLALADHGLAALAREPASPRTASTSTTARSPTRRSPKASASPSPTLPR